MTPLSPEDKAEVETIAEAARRKARTCPVCKTEDSVFRGKCANCSAYCEDGVWKMPPAEPKPKAGADPQPKPKDKDWNPFRLNW